MGVLHIFKDPTAYAGKTIHFAGDRITTRDLATAFVKLQMGLPVKHVPVDAQTFAKDVTNPEGFFPPGLIFSKTNLIRCDKYVPHVQYLPSRGSRQF